MRPPRDNKPEKIAKPSKNTCLFVESSCKQAKGRILKVTSHKPSRTIIVPNGIIKFANMRNSRAEDKSRTYARFATAIEKAKDSKRIECLVLCLADRSDVWSTFGICTLQKDADEENI